ncbi:hypothetical protein [Parabacteroides goldsteinii]|uniref:hypothetical protein n=1 Tax=Parabacteroides goldsteinii TaxID=328812 RepID=UPI000616F887|nr:hypothetical protein [Parabacteroides goldsteinii]
MIRLYNNSLCLWPSAYTDFSVASTPWKEGKGDLVRSVGKNSLLLLNLPPDKRGLIHENDISSLILRFAPVRCNKARIIINEARDVSQLSEIGFYKASEEEI